MEFLSDTPLLGNHEIGHSMPRPKDCGITRVNIQNLNGASLVNGGTWEITCEKWKEMEVDIALSSEHKIDTTLYKNIERMKEVATEIFGTGAFRLTANSTPNTAKPGDTKAGGTSALIKGPTVGGLISTHKDEAGRWTSITF
jgi:hypothetical protein